MNNETINVNELVKIEQMPKVFEQLEIIGNFIDEKVKDLDKLECTEENKKEVKNRRTEINNTLKLLEDKRKEIKNKINEPYDLFNKKYEETTKVKLERASQLLKEKIDVIEDEQKKKMETILRKYFNEYSQFKKINFVEFEQVGLNITLSATENKLREEIKSFLDRISEDLVLIESQEYSSEIFVEYKKTLNAHEAITAVINRHKELEQIQNEKEARTEETHTETEMIQEVEEVLKAPEKTDSENITEEVLEISFKVRGDRENLKKLVQYLREEGYEYEQL